MNVALNLAVDLDLAFRGDGAGDRQVLADNRRDHLARTQAGTFGSGSCWQRRLRIANAFDQFSHTLARLGLRREHRGTSSSQTETERLGTHRRHVPNSYATRSDYPGLSRSFPSRTNALVLLPKTISPRLGLLNPCWSLSSPR